MKTVDRTELFKKHKNKWVALDEKDNVISFSKTFEGALKNAEKRGFSNPTIAKIPDLKYSYLLA